MVVLVDPIDGTRGLMYQKRSAWILTGVAPLRPGIAPTLADIELAVQTEIPLVKQHLADALWATKGEGAHAERYDRITKERRPLRLAPSRATTIAQGFGCVARFFPAPATSSGPSTTTLVEQVLGPPEAGRAQAFEDQYISTGGQLYELVIGHDRWMADLRPLLGRARAARAPAWNVLPPVRSIDRAHRARGGRHRHRSHAGNRLLAPTRRVQRGGLDRLREPDARRASVTDAAQSARPASNQLDSHGDAPSAGGADRNLEIAKITARFEALAAGFDAGKPGGPRPRSRSAGMNLMGGIADYSGSLVLQMPSSWLRRGSLLSGATSRAWS